MGDAKYKRLAELGRGGMAVVCLAAMRSSHNVTKLVVIKELDRSLATDPEFRQMFLEEARLAARLNHPNVVQMYEVVDHVEHTSTRPDGLEGACALVMEWLEGQPLNRIRARIKDDPTALGFYIAVLIDALSGLEYAHTLADFDGKPLGLVHRDVSPHNIIVTYSGEVKVLDFGIAKANDSAVRPTDIGVVKGKLSYMAPEQARGERVDGRADVFAVGIMLWEAVVGRRMWAGMNDAAIMYKLQSSEVPSPRSVKPEVPEALDAICRRALAFKADDRYRSAAEMRDALEGYLETMPGRPSRRALGERVAKLFEEERAQVHKVLEEQLGRLKKAATDEFVAASVPSLPMPSITDSSVSHVGDRTQTSPTQASTTLSVSPQVGSRRSLVLIAVVMLALVSTTLSIVVLLRTSHVVTAAPPPPATSLVTSQPAPPSASVVQTAPTVTAPASASVAQPAASHIIAHPKPTAHTTATASPTDVGY